MDLIRLYKIIVLFFFLNMLIHILPDKYCPFQWAASVAKKIKLLNRDCLPYKSMKKAVACIHLNQTTCSVLFRTVI